MSRDGKHRNYSPIWEVYQLKNLILKILIFFGIFSTLPINVICQTQPKITFGIWNRRKVGNVYYAELWAAIAPGATWNVGDCSIYIQYNGNALNPLPFDNSIIDAEPELIEANRYAIIQKKIGNQSLLSLDIIWQDANIFIAKNGGGQGRDFRIGTLRWDITNGNADDNLEFSNRYTYIAEVVSPPPLTEKPIPKGTASNCYNTKSTTALQIDPSIYSCRNNFFLTTSCNSDVQIVERLDPRSAPMCERWPDDVTGGPAIAYYQYDLLTNYPVGTRARSFNPNDLINQADWARCKWQQQLSPAYFQWAQTNVGGKIWWSSNPVYWGGLASNAQGLTFPRFINNAPTVWEYVPASTCGKYGPNNEMQIMLNNTSELFNQSPHLRWTADYKGCGGGFDCIDFKALLLHELGHYIGLTHEVDHTTVMAGGILLPNITMTQCDADKARRLYSPNLIGSPPVNSGCSLTDVEEMNNYSKPLDIGVLSVSPSPVAAGSSFNVQYFLEKTSEVSLVITDILGRQHFLFENGRQTEGMHSMTFSTANMPVGVYLLRLEQAKRFTISKLVITR